MTGSYWQREATWHDRPPEGAVPSAADFIVIGGGLAGLATAIRLRELHPGADVVLLEAERVGYGASGRNAGFLSPLAAPVWLLGAERDPDQAWAAKRINADVHATARWLANNVADAELEAASLNMEGNGALWDGGLAQFASALELVGLAHRLDESRVRRGRRSIEMDAYTVHPYKLVRGLADHAERIGVRIRERARVRSIDGARVRLDDGAIAARKIIVCTNAYGAGLDVGERVRALVVHAFMTASAPIDTTAMVRGGDFTVEVALEQEFHRVHRDRILFGGGDKLLAPAGDDFAVPASVRAKLAKQLHARFPGATVAEAWAGKFHATSTGLPIIREAANSAVVLNVGYGGTGVALTLACARLAAAVASGRFASADDERLLEVIRRTRISVRDGVRTIARVLRRAVARDR